MKLLGFLLLSFVVWFILCFIFLYYIDWNNIEDKTKRELRLSGVRIISFIIVLIPWIIYLILS